MGGGVCVCEGGGVSKDGTKMYLREDQGQEDGPTHLEVRRGGEGLQIGPQNI